MIENKNKLFNLPEGFPLQIFMYKLGNVSAHWHQEIELIYVLEGQVEIVSNEQIFVLSEDDIYLTNAYSNHQLQSENAVILSLEINMEKLGVSEDERSSIIFDCNSSNSIDKDPFIKIKQLISSLINYNLKYQENNSYANLSMLYSLFAELMNRFRIIKSSIPPTNKNNLRARNIAKYLNDNYKSIITLKDLATEFDLSVPYISSIFEKHFGTNFHDYYSELRINKSLTTLLNTNKTISEIAEEFGFSDDRSYVRAFIKIHKDKPSEYRKKTKLNQPENEKILYSNFEKSKYLNKLLKHSDNNLRLKSPKHKNSIIYSIITSFNNPTTKLRKTYLNYLCVGSARDFLSYQTRKMIEEIQSEIKFKYVKFHGLLDDSMHVIKKYPEGYRYSFVYIDQIMDYILSLGLKPLIQLGFMPRALAKSDARTYDNGTIISAPKDHNEFIKLIEKLVHHLIDKYGIKEIESWPFTFWNAPDTTEHAFGFKDKYEFFELYKKVFIAIKNINSKIQIGSPSLLPLCDILIDFDKEFLNYSKRENVYPDFLIVHYYSNDFNQFFSDNPINEKLSENPDALKDFINFIKNPEFYKGGNIYITEFNFTSSHRNLLSDTVFNSCYIVKNVLENVDEVEAFGKWYLTDLIDESQLPSNMFHGGLGFFTYNGIKKPSYHAYKFLSKLDNEILKKDKGYFITKSNDSIKIILYNYGHYSSLYASGAYFQLNENNRYAPFEGNTKIRFEISIDDVNFDNYFYREYSLSRTSGSCYDIATKLGVTEDCTLEEIETIKGLSMPIFINKQENIRNNKINLSIEVDSLEVKLIEIKLYRTQD